MQKRKKVHDENPVPKKKMQQSKEQLFLFGDKNIEVSKVDDIKCKVTLQNKHQDLDPDFVYLLKRHTWHIYRLAPSNNLNYREVTLKRYASRFKQALAKLYNEKLNDVTFNATVTTLSDRETNENETDAKHLQIEVTQKRGDSAPQVKYKGLLLYWNDALYDNNRIFNLPLLLCTGTITITRIIHNTIQEIFDTIVRPIRISIDDIKWLILLNDLSLNTKNKKLVYFYYTVRLQKLGEVIKVTLPASFLDTLWKRIHPGAANEISYPEVEKFFHTIEETLTSYYQINFSQLHLQRITAPTITLMRSGRVKFFSEEIIVPILNFLIDSAIILQEPTTSMDERNR